MKLYMIRHGESTANAEKKHAGWAQIPLTEKGREDAKLAGKLLHGIQFDRIWVSDLIRAKETLSLALPDAEATETPLLREIGVGELSGKTIAECTELYGEPYLREKVNYNFVPFGGENHEMHLDRVRRFADTVAKDGADTVAAFCHAGGASRFGGIATERPIQDHEDFLSLVLQGEAKPFMRDADGIRFL